MYAPLVGSDKRGRANINRDERVNHTEYMKVMTGVPLWKERKGGRDGGEEEGREGRRRGGGREEEGREERG